ncbi:MAG: prepilin-type N-terminal cleavage/methylation domain-containing protein [Chthonomonadaceae bacterium]|jgi:prepilin-type N-terminal cleavage/methylation domain-containing protein|nr:prepilin-type N-terminal cleavage/methylation domain-containing protein [Chthonomonadaceae bacterium]
MNHKRAFTLIELLVVIAIIAILAAILFPVFAQAKVAAKGTASLSNIKQNGTAWNMYASDVDDTACPVWALTPGPLYFGPAGPNVPYSPWPQLLQPYMKNPNVTQDPLIQANPGEGNPPIPPQTVWPYRPQYGYAFTVWSPLTGYTTGLDGGPKPQLLTSAQNPAQTVVFVQRKSRVTLDWYTGSGIVWMAPTVAAPFCNTSGRSGTNPDGPCALVMRWGVGGCGGLNPYPTEEDGGRTGGVAIRKTGLGLALMADSSAKFMAPSKIAAGTNWHRNIAPGQIRMMDVEQYLWDLD